MTAPFTAYVVTAYRWGLRDAHSYVVGAYPTLDAAMQVARDHVEYRGGKYGCEVMCCQGEPNPSDGGENCWNEQVGYIESPFFGLGGQSRPACQPADHAKPILPAGWTSKGDAVGIPVGWDRNENFTPPNPDAAGTEPAECEPAEAFLPGAFIRDELAARKWSEGRLAGALGMSVAELKDLMAGNLPLTEREALALGRVWGQDPQTWLNLQRTYERYRERRGD